MKIAKITLFVTALALGVALFTPGQAIFASSITDQMQSGVDDIGGKDNPQTVESILPTAVNMLLFFVGALSVIMIIYSGFKYITSNGESSAITSAKNTLTYAVIGLIIAMLAYAIASFAFHIFDDNGSTTHGTPPTTPSNSNEGHTTPTPSGNSDPRPVINSNPTNPS